MHTTRRAIAVALLLSFTAGLAHAGPSEKAIEPIRDAFGKKIRLQLLQAPFGPVLEHLQRESGIPFIVDRVSLAQWMEAEIELSADAITIREALELTLQQVREVAGGDADYDVRNGRVIVTTRAKAIRPYLTTRVFDIRTLVRARKPFVGAPKVGLAGIHGRNHQSQQSLFEEGDEEVADVGGASAEMLVELIKLSVRAGEHSGNWMIPGVSIKEHNGLLVVVNTEGVLTNVADLLDKYQQAYGKMISVNARFVMIDHDALEKFIKDETAGQLVLTGPQVEAMLKLAAPEGGKAALLGTARTICFNAQRVYLTTGNERTFLGDLDPAVGTNALAFDPEMKTMINSTVLDVEPTASFDNKTVSMIIRADIAMGEKVEARKNSVAMSTPNKVAAGPTHDAKGNLGPGAVVVEPGGITPGTATIDVPDQDSARFRTSAKIPVGGGVLLSGLSTQFKHLKTDRREIVLLIQANVTP